MDRIQELSAADLDKVSGGIRVLATEVLNTEDFGAVVSKVESNRAQKEISDRLRKPLRR